MLVWRVVTSVLGLIVIFVSAACIRSPADTKHGTDSVTLSKTWSLFLICSPEWLNRQTPEELVRLYNAYLSVATASDDRNIPLWPFKAVSGGRAQDIDAAKSRPYCESLNLSDGPFVVITATPPDALKRSVPKVLIAFNGADAEAINATLLRLSERLIDKQLDDAPPGSSGWWTAWEEVSTWARSSIRDTNISIHGPGERRE